jgi:hypothetical protein
MREKINAHRVLVGKPEGRRRIGRFLSRREYNSKVNLKDMRWDSVESIYLIEDGSKWLALLQTVINIRFP